MKLHMTRGLAAFVLLCCSIVMLGQPAPLSSTLADLSADKLTAYYAPPAAYVSASQPCLEQSCFAGPAGDDYIKKLNRDFLGTYAQNVPNTRAQNQFNFLARQWESSGKAGLPSPPSYVLLDWAAFDRAWAGYAAQVTRCFTGEDAGKAICAEPGSILKAAIIGVPPVAPPLILSATASALVTSPIGPSNGPPFFLSSTGDDDTRFPNGAIYRDATGTYLKTIFATPFGAGGRSRFWEKVQ